MSNTNTLIENAVDKIIFEKDYIVILRDECFAVISSQKFLEYFTNGGESICDAVMNCWHTIGDFKGLHIDQNGEGGDCNCDYDSNPKIHFPKGEGIKVITNENDAKQSDSIYILAIDIPSEEEDGEPTKVYEMIVVDENGEKRKYYQREFPDIPIQSMRNVGGGIGIFKGMDRTIADIRTFEEGDGINFELSEDGNRIKISAPDPFSGTSKTFYVNENYQGATENGSILKPYKKLPHALRAIIGKADHPAYCASNPKYKSAVVILLSDVTVTDADLTDIPELNGRLSVDSVTYTSSDNKKYGIIFNASTDYPFDTVSLIAEDLALHPGNGNKLSHDISIAINNISITCYNVLGIIRHWSYDGHGDITSGTEKTASINISSVYASSHYKESDFTIFKPLKHYNGDQVYVYSSPVYGRDSSTETNNYWQTPQVHMYGRGNVGEGVINLNNLTVHVIGDIGIKMEDTTINQRDVIEIQPNNERVAVLTTNPVISGNYEPKPNTTLIQLDDVWTQYNDLIPVTTYPSVKVEDLSSPDGYSYKLAGGWDSFIRLTHNNAKTNTHNTLIIKNGLTLGMPFNYIVKIDSTVKWDIRLMNVDYKDLESQIMDFYKTSSAFVQDIFMLNCVFNNVKRNSISNINISSQLSIINRQIFSTSTPYSSKTDAINNGKLVIGNIYYNDATKQLEKITDYVLP